MFAMLNSLCSWTWRVISRSDYQFGHYMKPPDHHTHTFWEDTCKIGWNDLSWCTRNIRTSSARIYQCLMNDCINHQVSNGGHNVRPTENSSLINPAMTCSRTHHSSIRSRKIRTMKFVWRSTTYSSRQEKLDFPHNTSKSSKRSWQIG